LLSPLTSSILNIVYATLLLIVLSILLIRA
jgi:hypothetical protein